MVYTTLHNRPPVIGMISSCITPTEVTLCQLYWASCCTVSPVSSLCCSSSWNVLPSLTCMELISLGGANGTFSGSSFLYKILKIVSQHLLCHFSIESHRLWSIVESSVYFVYGYCSHKASPVAQWWRIRLPVQEPQVQSLGQEDPLEKEMATPSSIFSWKLHRPKSPAGYSPWVAKEWDTT